MTLLLHLVLLGRDDASHVD